MDEILRRLMPPPRDTRRYALFISHAWDYKDEYEGLVRLLNNDVTFSWENFSVPQENPLSAMFGALPKSFRSLVHQIDERISKVDCVLVLAGMYIKHRGWVQSEIEAARAFQKPIIAVEPRGRERFPDEVTHAANERVGWKGPSIIAAIRRCVAASQTPIPSLLPPALMPPPG